MRKHELIVGQTYHVFSRSIAGYVIFNNDEEYSRMRDIMLYYIKERPRLRFSEFLDLSMEYQAELKLVDEQSVDLVDIIAFCIMPTHFHLILKQREPDGISRYFKNILNSYTRYFNTKHNRKGPLWETRFKSVPIKDDVYLLHLTRYIHLNPVSLSLVENPSDWKYSSYTEYLGQSGRATKVCNYEGLLDIIPKRYKEFVEDKMAFQRNLQQIKGHLFD